MGASPHLQRAGGCPLGNDRGEAAGGPEVKPRFRGLTGGASTRLVDEYCVRAFVKSNDAVRSDMVKEMNDGVKEMILDAYWQMARKNRLPEVFYCTINFTGARGFLDRKVTVNTALYLKADYALKQFDRFFSAFQRSLIRPSYRFTCDENGSIRCTARKNVGSPMKKSDGSEWRIKAFTWVGVPDDKIKAREFSNGYRTLLDRVGVHTHSVMLIHRHIAQHFSTEELKDRMDEMARLSLGSAYEGGNFKRVADVTSDVERIVGYSSKIMSSPIQCIGDLTPTDLFEAWPQRR